MTKPTANASPPGLLNEGPSSKTARLSDPENATDLAALKQRLRDDPAFSKRMLRQAGILTSKGRVAKSFGG